MTEKRMNRFRDVVSKRLRDVIVLENIHDPHNALAAIRNCDAFGIQTAHFVFETEKVFNPEKLGKLTSASANKWIDSVSWNSTRECFSRLKRDGYRIYATILDPHASSLHDLTFPEGKAAVVFGNEGAGITETAKRMADELVYIPMSGFVDSINLSVSVGILLYELARQRNRTGQSRLTSGQQETLLNKWIGEETRKKYRL